jgi:hypothetical protein
MQLIPQKDFTVVRQIADHTDASTYYVQAVIRNAYTDAVIATLDLDSKGDQRYSKNWKVVADTSGEGLYVSIVTSVYTDSGHTAKSANYGDEEMTYLVKDLGRTIGGGGGGISAYDLKRIVKAEIDKIPKPEKVTIPKQEKVEVPLDEVYSRLNTIEESIAKLPQDLVDLTQVGEALETIATMIEEKEVTPETNIKPVLEGLEKGHEGIKESLVQIKSEIDEALRKQDENVGTRVKDSIQDNFNKANFSIGLNAPQIEKEQPAPQPNAKPFNIKDLQR